MKKNIAILSLLLLVVIIQGCSSYKLAQTTWFNISPAEYENTKGNVITSLRFVDDHNVDIFSSVIVDTTVVVRPYIIAKGTYTTTGNPQKEAKVTMSVTTLKNEKTTYTGVYHKNDAMIVVSADSLVKVYGKLKKKK